MRFHHAAGYFPLLPREHQVGHILRVVPLDLVLVLLLVEVVLVLALVDLPLSFYEDLARLPCILLSYM